MIYDVFISYSRKDTATADRICEALDRAGITYFIDRQGIAGGMEFPTVLAKAIRESELFLFLASENSYVSKFTINEITYAFNKKERNRIYPYIIDNSKLPDVMEFVFAGINWRTKREHPIESVLVPDLLRLLGRGERQTVNYSSQQTSKDLEFTVNGVSFKMIHVEGGTFQMGATPEQGSDTYDREKPVHSVTLSSYHIGETPVTQALWKAVMGDNPSWYKGDNLPVGNVSWEDCQEFIQKMNRLTGKIFRLTTEAEWEYAARGGKHLSPYKYAGSNSIDDVAWYNHNSGYETHSVKTKKPNALGIYDMSGNVYEWCQDWYGAYSGSAQTDPKGPASSLHRVVRGGSWGFMANACRVSSRLGFSPDHSGGDSGFRLAL